MNHPSEEDNANLLFRELFPPDEARLFAQPEGRRLPTQRVAYWSVAVSLLFAGALVVSWVVERNRPVQRSAANARTDKRAEGEPLNVARPKRKPATAPQP